MRLSILLVSLGLLAPVSHASAQRCELPQLLLTVDKSSSMLGGLPSGSTKWDAARMAIGELTAGYGDAIAFGLQVFPYPNRCEPGAVTMDFGAHSSADILTALGDPPPTGGNYTPMAQTLDAAHDHYATRLGGGENHLVLITDGWQWCDPHDPATRFTPVDAVTRLRALGVTVHVVGFGAAVDSLTLNRAAVAAGTDLPGCDATLSDPAALNHCYAHADDLIDLRAALDAIARDITEEMCDGLDNDCDELVDEGFDVDADGFTTCGSAPGADPDPLLSDCNDADGAVHPGAAELCDGLDNDCDGTLDPGCACIEGDAQPCGSDLGACTLGTQACVGGVWGECEGGVAPSEELCDGVDQDCDGTTDEGADASCAADEVCRPEGCIPLTPPTDDTPPRTDDPGDYVMDGGCACRASAPSSPSPIGVLLGLGLVGALIRRRRR